MSLSTTSAYLLNTSRDGVHFPGQPVPMLHNPFSEEMNEADDLGTVFPEPLDEMVLPLKN